MVAPPMHFRIGALRSGVSVISDPPTRLVHAVMHVSKSRCQLRCCEVSRQFCTRCLTKQLSLRLLSKKARSVNGPVVLEIT